MLESELFAFLEHTADAAFVLSESGGILYWNKSAEKLLGYTSKDVLHKTCYEVLEGVGPLGTHVCNEGCSVADCAGHDVEIPNFDMNIKARSGQRLWINMSTIVWTNPRTSQRLLVHLAHEITQQKKTEELAQKMMELSHQLAEIGDTALRPSPATPLSDQEKQVLRLFADGKSARAVAKSLRISAQTLRNHLHHINQKLRTHNRLEAVMNAIHRKLI